MEFKEFVASIVWSIEHVLSPGNKIEHLLGELWYRFWIWTPIDCNHTLYRFCIKDIRTGKLDLNNQEGRD
jgi:hypothetical protein